jgi:hypothetical protein
MNNEKQACSSFENLSKKTLLSMLPTDVDASRAIVLSTGQVIDISNYSQSTINQLLKQKTIVYYEKLQPRRMLLTTIDSNWSINSFNARTRVACIQIYSKTGTRFLSVTLQSYVTKFNL